MGNKQSSGGKSRQDRKLEKQRQAILLKQHEAQQKERAKEEGKLANADEFTRDVKMIRREEVPLTFLTRATHFSLPVLRQLEELFNRISASQVDDFVIDIEELSMAMGLRPNSLLARTLFRLFDITKSNTLNFRTWVLTLSALSTKATIDEKIRFSFGLYDLNGDGSIDLDELSGLLQAALLDSVSDFNPDEVREICEITLKVADRDGNGTIDLEEYTSLCKKSHGFLEAFSIDIEKLCQTITRRSLSGIPPSLEKQLAHGGAATMERPLNVMSAKLVAERESQFREKKLVRKGHNQLPGAIAEANVDANMNNISKASPNENSTLAPPAADLHSPASPAIDPIAEREMSCAAGGSSSHNLLQSLEALQQHLNPEALESAVNLMLGPSSPQTPQFVSAIQGVHVLQKDSSNMSDLSLSSPERPMSPSKPVVCCGTQSKVRTSSTVYPRSEGLPDSSSENELVPANPITPRKATAPIVTSTYGISLRIPSDSQSTFSSSFGSVSDGEFGRVSPGFNSNNNSPLPPGAPKITGQSISLRDIVGSGIVEEEVVDVMHVEDLDDLDVDHEDEVVAAKQRAELEETLSRGGLGANNALAELFRQNRDWSLNSASPGPSRGGVSPSSHHQVAPAAK